jgi:hypothetical protein
MLRTPMGSHRSGSEDGRQDPALEKHYSVLEVAKLWSLSENTVRRMFMGEPGVVEWGSEETRFKRAYKTMRIPESVLQRVHRRLAKVG